MNPFVAFLAVALLITKSLAVELSATISNSSGDYYITSTANEFESDVINCDEETTCNIVCQHSYGCRSMTVNGYNASQLQLTCSSREACYGANVDVTADAVEIDCTDKKSCKFLTLTVRNAATLAITCKNNSACYEAEYSLYGIKNTTVNALEEIFATYGTTWDFDSDTKQVSFNFDSQESTKYMTINAQNVQNLDIQCGGDLATSTPCYKLKVYCPSDIVNDTTCSINCDADTSACEAIDIYIPNADTYDSLQLSCADGDACNLGEIRCTGNSKVTTISYDYFADDWSCARDFDCCTRATESQVLEPAVSNTTGDYYYVNGSFLTVNCSSTAVCNIVCNHDYGCDGLLVRPVDSVGLNIFCSGYSACVDMVVDGNMNSADFQMQCNNDYSCLDVVISITDAETSSVDCSGNSACHSATFTLDYAENVNIACDTQTATSVTEASCYYSKFYARNITNATNIHLNSSYASYKTTFYLHYSSNVQLLASGSSAADSDIIFMNEMTNTPQVLDVQCLNGNSTSRACKGLGVYCPGDNETDTDSCDIYCGRPQSCFNIYISVPNVNTYHGLTLDCQNSESCLNGDLICTEGEGTQTTLSWNYFNKSWTCGVDECCPDGKYFVNSVEPDVSNSSGDYYISTMAHNFFEGVLNCSSSVKCHIICRHEGACSGLILRVLSASSPSLVIECLAVGSCLGFSFDAPGTGIDTFVLKCEGESACQDGIFNLGHVGTTDVSCTAKLACMYMELSISANVSNTSFTCDTAAVGLTGFGDAACESSVFSVYYSSITNIYVRGKYAAYNTEFNIFDSGAVTAEISGNRSSEEMTIYDWRATDVLLEVDCKGEYSCYGLDVHCPRLIGSNTTQLCNINCDYDYACTDSNIYIPDGEEYNVFDLDCGGNTSCIGAVIYCYDTGDTSSQLVWNRPESEWRCGTDDCCPDNVTLGVEPTDAPTNEPTTVTGNPTTVPSVGPTANPTTYPTTGDTTVGPTVEPTSEPTGGPTNKPSAHPTAAPEEPSNASCLLDVQIFIIFVFVACFLYQIKI